MEEKLVEMDNIADDDAPQQEEVPKNALLIYPNPEKKGRIRLGCEEYMPYITSRILLSGPPGSGKRNVILNLIRRMVPPPSVCHVIHHAPDTIEYDILSEWGIPMIMYSPSDFPTLKNIDNPWDDGEPKSEEDESDAKKDPQSDDEEPISQPIECSKVLDNPLIVVDEVTADALGKKGCHRFERMVNHACTHRNTTLLCSIQSATSIPACIRRGFNHFALWKQPDQMLNKILAQRASISHEMLGDLFGLLRDPHEFIWIDLDSDNDSEWRYRIGLMEPIQIVPVNSKNPS